MCKKLSKFLKNSCGSSAKSLFDLDGSCFHVLDILMRPIFDAIVGYLWFHLALNFIFKVKKFKVSSDKKMEFIQNIFKNN